MPLLGDLSKNKKDWIKSHSIFAVVRDPVLLVCLGDLRGLIRSDVHFGRKGLAAESTTVHDALHCAHRSSLDAAVWPLKNMQRSYFGCVPNRFHLVVIKLTVHRGTLQLPTQGNEGYA